MADQMVVLKADSTNHLWADSRVWTSVARWVVQKAGLLDVQMAGLTDHLWADSMDDLRAA